MIVVLVWEFFFLVGWFSLVISKMRGITSSSLQAVIMSSVLVLSYGLLHTGKEVPAA